MESSKLTVIGSTELVRVSGEDIEVPAKTDTGADSTAIWASDFRVEQDGTLSCVLFDKDSPLYTGKRHQFKDYKVAHVHSSNGTSQIRYRVNLELTIRGLKFTTPVNLSNRSRMTFPMLIGRHTLKGRFLVDVAQEAIPRPTHRLGQTDELISELEKDPYAFHQKYMINK